MGPAGEVVGQRRRRVDRLVGGGVRGIRGVGSGRGGDVKLQEHWWLLGLSDLLQLANGIRQRRGVAEDDAGERDVVNELAEELVPQDNEREGHGGGSGGGDVAW